VNAADIGEYRPALRSVAAERLQPVRLDLFSRANRRRPVKMVGSMTNSPLGYRLLVIAAAALFSTGGAAI
jgi:hypothetical protein